MTTKKQEAANKANAQKSSGPKSAAGKIKAAKNAVKHGVTGRPDWTRVTTFYKIIVEDSNARPNPSATDEWTRTALELAEAEASLQRAAQAERDYIFDGSAKMLRKKGTSQEFMEVIAELDLDDVDTIDFLMTRMTDPELVEGLKILKKVSPNRPAERRATLRRLARYRREAEARRRRALRAWISVLNKKIRSESKL
jgi:hypothetical protein